MVRKKSEKNINGKDSERFGKIRKITIKCQFNSDLLFVCFVLSISFFSCNTEDNSSEKHVKENGYYELNEKNCTDFAVKMHGSLVNGDTSFIHSYIDWQGLKDAISMDSSYWDQYRNEIFTSWKKSISPGVELINELEKGSHLRFITYYQLDGEHYIILRNYIEPQTVNYIEFKLVGKLHSIAIADIYDFNQSMNLSSMAKEYCDYLGDFKEFWSITLSEMTNDCDSVKSKINEGNLKDAYMLLKATQLNFQQTYIYRGLMEQVLLKSEISSVSQGYLFEKSQKIPLGEKGRSLTMFYLNAYAAKYNDALIALANLENAVGEDGVLDYLRGNIYFEQNEMSKALSSFNKALAYNSKIFSFHIAKVKTLIEQSQYIEAVESLLVLDDFFNIQELNWNEEFSEYPNFLTSEAYKLWLNRLNS